MISCLICVRAYFSVGLTICVFQGTNVPHPLNVNQSLESSGGDGSVTVKGGNENAPSEGKQDIEDGTMKSGSPSSANNNRSGGKPPLSQSLWPTSTIPALQFLEDGFHELLRCRLVRWHRRLRLHQIILNTHQSLLVFVHDLLLGFK